MINLESIAYQFKVVSLPVTAASLLVTEDCNLRCKYCFETHNKNKMSYEVADRTVDFLFENAQKGKVNAVEMTFFGGEPMMAPDVIERITRRAWDLEQRTGIEAKLGIITNGTFLPESMKALFIEAIGRNKAIGVQISVDGPPEIHDRYRVTVDQKPSFHMVAKTFKEYEAIYTGGYAEFVNVHGVLSKETIGHLYESYSYFLDNHPFKRLWFLPVCEEDWSLDDVKLYHNEMGKIYDDIMNVYRRTGNTKIIENYSPLDRSLWKNERGGAPCGAGKQYCTITSNGEIYPCHHIYFNDPDKESFMGTIWTGIDDASRRIYTEYTSDDMTCGDCDHDYCYRCIAVNLIHNGSILSQVRGNYCKLMKVDKYYQDLIKKEINNMGIIDGNSNRPITSDEAGFDCGLVYRDHGNCHIVDIGGMQPSKSTIPPVALAPANVASKPTFTPTISPELARARALHPVYDGYKMINDLLVGDEYELNLTGPYGEVSKQTFIIPKQEVKSSCGEGGCGCASKKETQEMTEFEQTVINAITVLLEKVDIIEKIVLKK